MRISYPDNFDLLPDAFNTLGRAMFPKTWNGKELGARRDLPKPASTFKRIRRAERKLQQERTEAERRAKEAQAAKVVAARKASPRVPSFDDPAPPPRRTFHKPKPSADEIDRQRIKELAGRADLTPEVVRAADNQQAYRKEYAARAATRFRRCDAQFGGLISALARRDRPTAQRGELGRALYRADRSTEFTIVRP